MLFKEFETDDFLLITATTNQTLSCIIFFLQLLAVIPFQKAAGPLINPSPAELFISVNNRQKRFKF